jgi:hypothetical protein
MAEEFVYAMEGCQGCQPGDYKYSPAKAGKYFARAIVRHLGWDVSAGVAGTDHPVIRALATLMAGVQPAPVPFTVQTVATPLTCHLVGIMSPSGRMGWRSTKTPASR